MHADFSVDPRKVEQARRLLGLSSDAEAIEVALDLLILDDAYACAQSGEPSDESGRLGRPGTSDPSRASTRNVPTGVAPAGATAAFPD